jgi:hypothetical protein
LPYLKILSVSRPNRGYRRLKSTGRRGASDIPNKIRRNGSRGKLLTPEFSPSLRETEGVRNVSNPHLIAGYDYPDDVESIRLPGSAVPVDPDAGGPGKLDPFFPVDRLDRAAEMVVAPGLDLDERDDSIPLDYQVDVTVPVPEAAVEDLPAVAREPAFRDPFSNFAQGLRGR